MKRKLIVIVFLTYFFAGSGDLIRYNNNENLTISKNQLYESRNIIATRGAIIEAIFILQNRRNFINNYITRCKEILNEATLISNALSKKIRLTNKNVFTNNFKHFSFFDKNKNCKSYMTLEHHILEGLSKLAIYNTEIYKSANSLLLYPDYILQLKKYLDYIDDSIKNFTNDNVFSYMEIRENVDCATIMQDLSEEESLMSNIFYEIYKNEFIIQKLNSLINTYSEQNKRTNKFNLIKDKLNIALNNTLNLNKKNKLHLKENTKNILSLHDQLNKKVNHNYNSNKFYNTFLAYNNISIGTSA